jgi:hypothetical protein
VNAKGLAYMSKNIELYQVVLLYEEVFSRLFLLNIVKLCFVLYCFLFLRNQNRQNFLNKLTPEMIQKLTHYIIP